ncbi:PP8 [Orf virus]|uniref:PP8 n=1 Tax=Orf virus TaxID=10258 RepID=F1AXI1_ORFV|nr:PP8 [Orf virus]
MCSGVRPRSSLAFTYAPCSTSSAITAASAPPMQPSRLKYSISALMLRSRSLTLAPWRMSARSVSGVTVPKHMYECSGVNPQSDVAFTSAPAASSSRTASGSSGLLRMSMCSGAYPRGPA